MENKVRLQKFLAQAGVSSRRKAEELIKQGLVSVNGTVVTEMGTKIDPEKDSVRLQGKRVGAITTKKVTLLLYKPKGYLTTLSDPLERPTVQDLVPKTKFSRLFPIGRLDYNSEGLLLLTNDGDLAYALTHPRHQIEKIYLAKIRGIPTKATLQELRQGIKLDDGITAPCQVNILSSANDKCWMEIILKEGKNRQIRRMGDVVGHTVLKLKRVGLAFLTLEGLTPGQYRLLSAKEVKMLKELAMGESPQTF